MTQPVGEREPEVSSGDSPAEAPVVRRRLGPGPGEEDRSGRTGCLATGALLGIIFGIMFALYGLKPILQYFYGEETVDPGVEYRDDDVALSWVSFGTEPAPDPDDVPPPNVRVIVANLEVEAIEAWEPAPAEMQLEVSSQDEWIVARPPTTSSGSHDVAAGETGTLVLRFWVPAEDFEVEALHIADPRLNMLPPPQE